MYLYSFIYIGNREFTLMSPILIQCHRLTLFSTFIILFPYWDTCLPWSLPPNSWAPTAEARPCSDGISPYMEGKALHRPPAHRGAALLSPTHCLLGSGREGMETGWVGNGVERTRIVSVREAHSCHMNSFRQVCPCSLLHARRHLHSHLAILSRVTFNFTWYVIKVISAMINLLPQCLCVCTLKGAFSMKETTINQVNVPITLSTDI